MGSGVVWLLSARGHNAIMAPTNKGVDLGYCSTRVGRQLQLRAERDMPGLDHTTRGYAKLTQRVWRLGRSPSRFATLALFKPQKHDTFAYTAFASASNLCLRTYIQSFTSGNLVWGCIRPRKLPSRYGWRYVYLSVR